MNKKIKEFAIEAKLGAALLLHYWGRVEALTDSEQEDLKRIEHFAELVAQDEREECAKLATEHAAKYKNPMMNTDTTKVATAACKRIAHLISERGQA